MRNSAYVMVAESLSPEGKKETTTTSVASLGGPVWPEKWPQCCGEKNKLLRELRKKNHFFPTL